MNIIKKLYRHGDLLIRQIDKLPQGLVKSTDKNVLAFGEVTGHSHRLTIPECVVLQEPKTMKKFINLNQETELIHEEHDTIQIPKGLFEVVNEREFDPFEQEIKQVLD